MGGRPLVGVGVGVGGIVRRYESTIVHSIPLNISTPVSFDKLIEGLVTVPVLVENDAKCCAWRELVFDRTNAPRNSLFVLLELRKGPASATYGGGVGLGLGFVINGTVYYGENGSAGEFRSIDWTPKYSSQFSIRDADVIDISEKAQAMDAMIEQLARHLALFVNTLNLKKIYIGGDAGEFGPRIVETVRTAIQNNWPYSEPVDCAVQLAVSDAETVAVGAAAMVLERIFEEPILPSGLRDRNHIWTQIIRARGDGSE